MNLLEYLKSPESIRGLSHQVLQAATANNLLYFSYHPNKLEETAQYVIDVIEQTYPDHNIPYHSRWRHFDTQARSRSQIFYEAIQKAYPNDKVAQTKSAIELTIISVLLDAGAGMQWQYHDEASNESLTKSEGLAVASFNLFMDGFFSSQKDNPYQVDLERLQAISEDELAKGFQSSASNELLGLSGRLDLLLRLSEVLDVQSRYFPDKRLGNIVNVWRKEVKDNKLSMLVIFDSLLCGLSEIWPNATEIMGFCFGDIWQYSPLSSRHNPSGWIPFHKLTQWLSYSLAEPLESMNIVVTDLEKLTGLPEYRNGGLFLDMGVLSLSNSTLFKEAHAVSSELIIEWRALTVALLDQVAAMIRKKLNMSEQTLPLVKILEGGTWAAGRKLAAKKRADGGPPLQILSSGTVF